MLEDKAVLIIADNAYLATDLCDAVEQLQGRVVGPVSSVADALGVLDGELVAAAVVDCDLAEGDVTPLADALLRKGIPFVIQSTSAVPPGIARLRLGVPVLVKPIQPHDVVSILAHEVIKAELQ